MSDDIFIKQDQVIGQQPFISQTAVSGQAYTTSQRVYQVPSIGQTPFTYVNRTPTITQSALNVQNPSTYQHRSPLTYNHRSPLTYDHRSPLTYNHRSPFTYNARQPSTYQHQSPSIYQITYTRRSPSTYTHQSPSIVQTTASKQSPFAYDHRSPFTYAHQSPLTYDHRSPLTYNHRSPYQSPLTYDHRSPFEYNTQTTFQSPFLYQHREPSTYQHRTPSTYQNRSPVQSPFTYDHRSPSTYQHRSSFQSPFTYDHRSPSTYQARQPVASQLVTAANYQHPVSVSKQSPFIANSQTTATRQVQQPFVWGTMGTFSNLDTTITSTRTDGGRSKAYVATKFTVGASSGTGGSIVIQVFYGTQSGGSSSSSITLNYTGGLDSLEARVVYQNAAAGKTEQSNGGDGIFGFAFSQTDVITSNDFTEDTTSASGDISTLFIGNGSQGSTTTGITPTGVTTGSSNYVALGRNGFSNQGICGVSIICCSEANSGQAVREDEFDADTASQFMGIQLRANGDNVDQITIWSQETLVRTQSEDEASSS